MSKVISIIALIVALTACLMIRWVFITQQKSLEHALKQREAQLTQRYTGLINRMIDRVSHSESKSTARTVEQALDRLSEILEASRQSEIADAPPQVSNIGGADAVQSGSPEFQFTAHDAERLIHGGGGHLGHDLSGNSSNGLHAAAPNIAIDRSADEPFGNDGQLSSVKGRIAYVADDGDPEIYLINANGTNKTRLTHNHDHDLYPAWSPDGQSIAFVSDQNGNRDLYIMNADGENLEQITDSIALEGAASWSPDGSKIAVEVRSGNIAEIQIIPLLESRQPTVISNAAMPSWSPDGAQIAFNRGPNIYVSRADGSGEKRLYTEEITDQKHMAVLPRWSPDGKDLMYSGVHVASTDPDVQVSAKPGVYIFNMATERSRRLSADGVAELGLDWSADGRHIIFYSTSDGRAQMFIRSSAGGMASRITTTSGLSQWASWRPAP